MSKIELGNFTIDDLKKMRLFITEKGRPTSDLTDSMWQEIFKKIKNKINPLENGKNKKMIIKSTKVVMNEWGEYEEDQTSDWKRYCMFINTVLDDIRDGEISYCYYFYQISQLLAFHKDDLRTRYNESEKHWEVWLDK